MSNEQFTKIRRAIDGSLEDLERGWITYLNINIVVEDGEINYSIKAQINKEDEH